jgi:hypothetical protein
MNHSAAAATKDNAAAAAVKAADADFKAGKLDKEGLKKKLYGLQKDLITQIKAKMTPEQMPKFKAWVHSLGDFNYAKLLAIAPAKRAANKTGPQNTALNNDKKPPRKWGLFS